ncbi:MAG: hypothetical protein HZC12_09070 [Nitrospirae bacterium]|nr:hypothetical protein [Nitrospirota bacterium]
MEEKPKKVYQRHYVAKEIRLSIAFIIIWALLGGVLMVFFSKTIGDYITNGLLAFALIAIGYLFLVVVLSVLFTRYFIGPFDRLLSEIRFIKKGHFDKKLKIRLRDDQRLKNFIDEVNGLIEMINTATSVNKEEFRNTFNKELFTLLKLAESNPSAEELSKAVLALQTKVETFSETHSL